MQVDLVLELVLICSKSTSAVVVRLNIDSLIRDSYSNCRQLGTTVIGATITDVDVDVHEAVISLGAVSRLSVVREKRKRRKSPSIQRDDNQGWLPVKRHTVRYRAIYAYNQRGKRGHEHVRKLLPLRTRT
jgi:hypothetical protein